MANFTSLRLLLFIVQNIVYEHIILLCGLLGKGQFRNGFYLNLRWYMDH